jgi:Ricin-type beta-trefoil lectin domain-like
MDTRIIASSLVALSLGAFFTACGGAETSSGPETAGEEAEFAQTGSDFDPEFALSEEEITACDDQHYDHWRHLAALAVASANELGRWNAARDFKKVQGPSIQLSAEGLARCVDGCENIKAILELQDDVTKLIPRHDPAMLRQYLVGFYDRQVAWNSSNPVADHSLKLAAVSPDICGFRYHFDVTGATSPPSWSGVTEIKPVHSNKCADVAAESMADGAALIQYACWGGNNQKFTVESQGNNTYRLKNIRSGKCIGVAYGATNDAAALEQRWCGANNSQLFQLNRKSNNTFELKNVNSGRCVDVRYNSIDNSTLLQIYACHGGANQTFAMTLTSTTTTTPMDPAGLVNQLKFAGDTENKYLMFQSTSTQASIDPMGTMVNGGYTAKSGSCVDGATVFGLGVAGNCCSVNGKFGTLVQSAWNKKLAYCK